MVTTLVISHGRGLRHGDRGHIFVLFLSSSGLPLPLPLPEGAQRRQNKPGPGIFPSLPFPRLEGYLGGHGVLPLASGSLRTCSGGLPLVVGLISPPTPLGRLPHNWSFVTLWSRRKLLPTTEA